MTDTHAALKDLDDFGIEVPSLGVREFRYPVQGVHHAGNAAGSVGEDRRRGAGQRVDRAGTEGVDPHPVGQGRRLRGPDARTPRSWGCRSGR